ncbi:MAG: hypothetical protein QF464_00815 [Myxococcota bacterium]|nr:hypothetical protein [Myxococcota bacterium]
MSPASAMQVASAPIAALVDEADLAVRGMVLSSESEQVPGHPHRLRTRHVLVVWEHLKAPKVRARVAGPTTGIELLEVVQPGGRIGSIVAMVPGVAALPLGAEVILLLTRTPWGLQPIGYRLGTFFVQANGVVKPAWPGHLPRAPLAPLTIDSLRGAQP